MPDTEQCPTCGTTSLIFDPPIALIEAEACGAVKPGTYARDVPTCVLPAGHEGKHVHLVEYTETW